MFHIINLTIYFSSLGLEVVPNGITFIVDDTDSKVGDAYVQFSNKDVVEKALERHMQKIRHRYYKCGVFVTVF